MGQVIFTSGQNENTAVMELEIDKVTQASSLRIIASKMFAVLCAFAAGYPRRRIAALQRLPCNHRKTEIPDTEK